MTNDQLPPNVGKHECRRKDGSYGYICNACGYPVEGHDGYCSECGARVAGTLFYYGNHFKLCDRKSAFLALVVILLAIQIIGKIKRIDEQ